MLKTHVQRTVNTQFIKVKSIIDKMYFGTINFLLFYLTSMDYVALYQSTYLIPIVIHCASLVVWNLLQ